MAPMISDVRQAIRLARKDLPFSLMVVALVAVGIGISAAVHGVIQSLLFPSLNVHEKDQLFTAYVQDARGRYAGLPTDWHSRLAIDWSGVGELTASARIRVGVSTPAFAGTVPAQLVAPNYFEVVGVRPSLGRLFSAADTSETLTRPVVVLGFEFNRTAFNGSDVVGQRILVRGVESVIVGVAPSSFRGIVGRSVNPVAMWILDPMGSLGRTLQAGDDFESTIRLNDRHSLENATPVLTQVFQALRTSQGRATDQRIVLVPSAQVVVHPRTDATWRRVGTVANALALAVLLVMSVNLAATSVTRAAGRRKEVALRMALGASRLAIVRQLLIEQLLLVAVGTALGAVAGLLLITMAASWLPLLLPIASTGSALLYIDAGWFGYAMTLCVGVSLVTSLLPAVRLSFHQISPGLTADSLIFLPAGRRLRVLQFMVIPQIAISVALLAIVPALASTAAREIGSDRGFGLDGAAFLRADLSLFGYDTGRAADFRRALEPRLKNLPYGIRAAFSDWPSPDGSQELVGVRTELTGKRTSIASLHRLAPGAVNVIGMRLIRGREFSESDTAVAIVDSRTAEREWPSVDPIGQGLQINAPGQSRPGAFEVVGMVAPVIDLPVGDTRDRVYIPFNAAPTPLIGIVARGDASDEVTAELLATALREVNPEVRPSVVNTFANYAAQLSLPARTTLGLVMILGVLGLLIAMLGLVSSVQHAMTHRKKEFALRLALGGSPWRLGRAIVARTAGLIGIGVAVGLALTPMAERLVLAQLGTVPSNSRWPIVMVAALAVGAGVLATLPSVIRAAKMSPAAELRSGPHG